MITDEISNNAFDILTESFSCKECGKIESNEIDLEIHEFLKHSSFGTQLEAEIDNCKVFVNHPEATSTLYICTLCSTQIENSDIMLLHFLEDHCHEIVSQFNTW